MRTKNLVALFVAGALMLTVVTKSSAKGGDNGRFSVGAELGLPMGNFGDAATTGFGGSVRYEMPEGDNLGLTGTVGYLTFSAKTGGLVSASYSMIPIMVGAKYYFTEQQNGFYGAFALGLTMTTAKVTIPAIVVNGVTVFPETTASASTSDFTFAPGIGYHLANIDLGLNYNIVSASGGSLSYLGLRVAYVFGEK